MSFEAVTGAGYKYVECECGEKVRYHLEAFTPQCCPKCNRSLSVQATQFQRG